MCADCGAAGPPRGLRTEAAAGGPPEPSSDRLYPWVGGGGTWVQNGTLPAPGPVVGAAGGPRPIFGPRPVRAAAAQMGPAGGELGRRLGG